MGKTRFQRWRVLSPGVRPSWTGLRWCGPAELRSGLKSCAGPDNPAPPARVMFTILFFAVVMSVSVGAQDKQNSVDTFFKGLIPGKAEGGKVYLEAPLKPDFFARAKTPDESQAVWASFFCRVAGKEVERDNSGRTFCPHYFTDQNFDQAYVAVAADLQVGDLVTIQTESGRGIARVTGYEIYSDDAGPGTQLLAVAQPTMGSVIYGEAFLVAARNIPPCETACVNSKKQPAPNVLAEIKSRLLSGSNIPKDKSLDDMIVFQGHFTRRDREQYVVYANFGAAIVKDMPSFSYWRSLIFDADFSILTVLGENEYLHVIPESIGDVTGDGLDEIWAHFQGYEGYTNGILYWRGGQGKKAFGKITAAYKGL